MKKNYYLLTLAFVCFCLGVVGIKHTQIIAQEIEASTKPCYANSCYDLNYDCRPKYCFVSGLLICFDAKGNLLLSKNCKLVGKPKISKNSYSALIDCDGDKKADQGYSLKFSKDECGSKHPCAKATGKVSFYDKGKKFADCKAIAYYVGAPQTSSSGELDDSYNSGCLKSPVKSE
ncbi:MAG: hypothetical protein U0586_02040 [Candidatus Brocadiaceae bacterium]